MAHFDRAISPGGEGKVTLEIDLKGVQGPVWKSATLISNDPQKPSVSLSLHGKVRPHIECRPGSFIQFNGREAGQPERTIDILATLKPFQIKKIDNSLKEKVSYQLYTIVSGRHYQLKVMNLKKTEKFSGNIKCLTDHPKKPEIQISVNNNPNG
ncbi:MAG: hypothetical protein C0407_10375 [Desulfobacca sp.]|nr:hypothetical protein [Desulfobacca sp.]